MVACMCACCPARRLNSCSSAHCWARGPVLLHPHHGLALTHPRSLFTHWVFCPLPPTAVRGRIPLLSPPRTVSGVHMLANSLHREPHTQYVQMDSEWRQSVPEPIEKDTATSRAAWYQDVYLFWFFFFFKLNSFPVVPTAWTSNL